MEPPGISRRLRWLKGVDLVEGKKERRHVCYSITGPDLVEKIIEIRDYLPRKID